jgi:hypothetical protein
MIQVAPGTKVYLACRPVSMRYGFDGLAAKVTQVLNADPFSGHLFLFRSKRADYFKILYYDGTGLCIFAKRLESHKFVWPPHSSPHSCWDTKESIDHGSDSGKNRMSGAGGISLRIRQYDFYCRTNDKSPAPQQPVEGYHGRPKAAVLQQSGQAGP